MEIGEVVKIKECHKIPELVGQEAKIVALVHPEIAKYPVAVVFTDGTPGVFGFREDELEPPDTDIPDVFKDALND